MVEPDDALPGRDTPVVVTVPHRVLGTSMVAPFPEGSESVVVAMGCFWGAERLFWELPGVITTAAGYAGGFTPNPTHDEVGSGRTGHAESVLVVFDPDRVTRADVLRRFWEGHDPTQGYRQGGDVGTQYRSMILASSDEQQAAAAAGRTRYDEALAAAHFDPITTEVERGTTFFYADDAHQQYLARDPEGYCGVEGTGVALPGGREVAEG